MVDNDFNIQDILPNGVTLNMPPLLKGVSQLLLEKEI